MEIVFGVPEDNANSAQKEKTSKVSRRFFKKMELDFANTAQQRCGIPQLQKIHFDDGMAPPDERRPLPDKRNTSIRQSSIYGLLNITGHAMGTPKFW
jgi:hypothetical protein